MAKGKGFSPHPDWLDECSDLSFGAKCIWAVFSRLQGTDAFSYPSYATVARMVGSTERKLMRYIDELERKGLLEIRITSFTGTQINYYGFRTNLFIAHHQPCHFLTRAQQRRARAPSKASAV